MKTLLVTFSIVLLWPLTANCQTTECSNMSFTFPFSQGDAKWKEFKTSRDRIAALQIPENTLASISTEDLLFICFDYPYLSDVFAFDNMESGVKSVASKFNGLREFMLRQDQTEVLEKVFQRISTEHLFLGRSSGQEIGHNSLRISVLSYLLGRSEVLDRMIVSKKKNLLQLTQANIDTIFHYPDYTTSFGLSALKRLKHLLNESPERQIYGDYESVTRYTPNGSSVLAWKLFRNELSQTDKDYLEEQAETNYNAHAVSEATKTYNCHGFAWHMTAGGDSVWIGLTPNSYTDENIYWTDGSYVEVPESLATRVSYYESDSTNHSAIRITNNLYLSKWGLGPLMEHVPDGCPYYSSMPKKFYSAPVLSGPSTICSSSTGTYTVSGLPNVFTVNWYFSDGFGPTPPTIQSSGHSCTVVNNITKTYMGTLNAAIYYNSTLIRTLKKENIMVYSGFYGLYGLVGAVNQEIYPGTPIWVTKGSNVCLKSPNMIHKSVSYSVTTPSSWNYYGDTGTLFVKYPNVSTNNPLYINIQNDPNYPNCDNSYQLVILPNNILPGYSLGIVIGDNGQITVSLVENENTDKLKSVVGFDTEKTPKTSNWTLESYNANTGKKVFGKEISGTTYSIDTTGWVSGIYVIKAVVGEEVLSEKIMLK